MLQYHALKQKASKSQAEFIDREMCEYLALRYMGIHVDDSIWLIKFAGQHIINSSHAATVQLYPPWPILRSLPD